MKEYLELLPSFIIWMFIFGGVYGFSLQKLGWTGFEQGFYVGAATGLIVLNAMRFDP